MYQKKTGRRDEFDIHVELNLEFICSRSIHWRFLPGPLGVFTYTVVLGLLLCSSGRKVSVSMRGCVARPQSRGTLFVKHNDQSMAAQLRTITPLTRCVGSCYDFRRQWMSIMVTQYLKGCILWSQILFLVNFRRRFQWIWNSSF